MKLNIILAISVLAITTLTLNGCNKKEEVLIISSSEDFRNVEIQESLDEKFPQYNIQVQYMSTGKAAAKLKAEGSDTDMDIILGLEAGYLGQNVESLADHSTYDTDVFLQELVPLDKTYLPWERYSGCIAIREDILEEKGLSIPTTYDDLLKEEYKGLISMPNPKMSGTGYMFLLKMVNERGEEEAFAYFDDLAENLLHFTSSGSGPINDLMQGEVAIGLGMTFQGVTEINKGANISINYFEEGAPYTATGFAMIKGKDKQQEVKEVFDYIESTLLLMDKEKFSPEQIFTNQVNKIPNYPQDIIYGDMTSDNPVEMKAELLGKWNH